MGQINVLKIISGKPAAAITTSLRKLSRKGGRRIPKEAAANTRIELSEHCLNDIGDTRALLRAVSASQKLELAWIVASSVTDAFLYSHFKNGRELRSLALGETEQFRWERVAGKPEAWERDAYRDEIVSNLRNRKCELGKRGRWPRVGDLALAPDAMKFANAALEFGAPPIKGVSKLFPALPENPAAELTWRKNPKWRVKPWKF